MKKTLNLTKPAKVILCILLLLLQAPELYSTNRGKPKTRKTKEFSKQVSGWLKDQPVEFMENKGQFMNSENKAAGNVFFKAEAPGIDLYVTTSGLSYVFLQYTEEEKSKKERRREELLGISEEHETVKVNYERIDLNLAGASIKKENIIKEDTGTAYYNYLLGPGDKSIFHVKKYRKITIRNVYKGIDWVLYNSSASGFKYDFVVHPGADAKQIELVYRSKKELNISENGSLLLESSAGMLEEKAPYSYALESGMSVESSFKFISKEKKSGVFETHIGFELPDHNRANTVVIDPQLVWATFYGGTNFEGTYCIDTDPAGNVFLCGYGASNNFPVLSMGTFYISTFIAASGFIIKFDNSGKLLWSTYFGPATTLYLATDNAGSIFVCGSTSSTLFPTVNANTYYQGGLGGGGGDAYIAKFDNLGNYVWGTYYGGTGVDAGNTVATDQNGNVFLVGNTTSTNFPLQNAGTYFEPAITGGNSGYIVKFDNAGNRLWATYLKGLSTTGMPIATDPSGNVYIAGSTGLLIPLLNAGGTSYYQGVTGGVTDSYILKFDNAGNQLWGTYYGSSNIDRATSLATDRNGNIFVTGITTSTNFPVQNPGNGAYFQGNLAGTLQDVFLLKFDNSGTRQWATYFGGTRQESHMEYDNLTVDTCGNVFLGFTTVSRNLPFQAACDSGMFDNTLDTSASTTANNVYLARFSNTGQLMWSSYFGGDGPSFRTTMDADKFGNVFFSGEWGLGTATTYPLVYPPSPTYTSNFMGFEDLYVAKFTNNIFPQNFSYPALCANDTSRLPTLAPKFLTGGTFSASPGLSLNPQSGQIITSASAPGNYTVNYIMSPCYCPGASAKIVGTATVSILNAPTLTITGKTSMCVGEKATFTVSGATSYTWNTGLVSPTITANPSTTATINYTASTKSSSGCVSKKTHTVTVNKCTDIQSFEISSGRVQVYPNPNSGEFTISADKDIQLDLVNALGQFIRRIELSAKNERMIEIRNLSNGVYFLVDKSSRQSTNYKIVVTD